MKKLVKIFIITLLVTSFGLLLNLKSSLFTSAMTEQEMVERDCDLVTVPNKAILSFPVATKSVYNNTITWASSNEDVLEFMDGWFVVYRSKVEDFNVTVTVTVTRENSSAEATKDFNVFIPKGKTLTSSFIISYHNVEEEVENFKTSYKLGDPTYLLEEPTKEGYNFDGWYTDEALSTKIEKITVGSQGNFNLYAKWNIKTYTVTFLNDDDSLIDTQVVNHGSSAIEPSSPTKDATAEFTYTFDGWDTSFESVTNDLVVKAKYTAIKNKYTVTFFDEDGTTVLGSKEVEYGNVVSAIEALEKVGYEFSGWYTTLGYETEYNFESLITNHVSLYAKWAFALVDYTVIYYLETLEETFALKEEVINQAYTNSTVEATPKTYEGFSLDNVTSILSGTVKADGTLVLKVYYTRNLYVITIDVDGGNPVDNIEAKYGAIVTAPTVSKTGFAFDGYDPTFPETMPLGGATIKAKWVAVEVNYHVEHYFENANDNEYSLYDTITLQALTGSTVTATTIEVDGFTLHDDYLDVGGTVLADGSLVLKLYYTRNVYTIKVDVDDDISEIVAKYNAAVFVDEPTKTGFVFDGWDPEFPETMPLGGLTVTAIWKPAMVDYKVEHYFENTNDDGYSLNDTIALQALTGSSVTATTIEVEGFTNITHELEVKTGTVLADGSLVLKLYYSRNQYTITIDLDGGTGITSLSAKHGASIMAPVVTKEEYTFSGWEPLFPDVMPLGNITVKALWTQLPVYQVIFNTDGGSEVSTQNVIENKKAICPAVPTKEGYTFVYWYLSDSEVPFDFETLITSNITLNAKWDLEEFDINFITNGDSMIEAIKVKYLDDIPMLPTPTKTGYSFGGWFTDEGLTESFILEKMPANNITLYASWIVNQYTISFDSNEGSEVASITQDYNTVVLKPNDPEKSGYDFVGWYSDIELEIPYVFDKMPAENIILYAKWEAKTFTITFVTNGGTSLEPIEVAYLDDIPAFGTTTLEGHIFSGWYLDENFDTSFDATIMPAEDIILYAKWKKAEYKVTFVTNSEMTIEDRNLYYGDEMPETIIPTKVGHDFMGWYLDEECTTLFTTMPAMPVTVYAKWIINSYTITFDTNGGEELASMTLEYDEEIILVNPIRTGYDFIGWYVAGELFELERMPALDFTLKAEWVPTNYTITYEFIKPIDYTGEINNDNPTTYNILSEFTFSNIEVNEGYEFFGWYLDDLTTLITHVSEGSYGNKIIYGKIEYAPAKRVELDKADLNAQYGSVLTGILSDELIETLTSLRIIGENGSEITWQSNNTAVSVASNGTLTITQGVDDELVNLSALVEYSDNIEIVSFSFTVPKLIKYTVTFNSLGGSTVNQVEVVKGKLLTKPINPTKEGYELVDWYTSDDEGITLSENPFDFNTPITSDLTLYAKWIINQYTISFITNGGSTLSNITLNFNQTIPTFDETTKDGHTFIGWFTDEDLTDEFDLITMPAYNITLYAKWELAESNTSLPFTVTFTNTSSDPVDGWTYGGLGTAYKDNGLPFKASGAYILSPEYNFNSEIKLTLGVVGNGTTGSGSVVKFIAYDENDSEIEIINVSIISTKSSEGHDLIAVLPSGTKRIKIEYVKTTGNISVHTLKIEVNQ